MVATKLIVALQRNPRLLFFLDATGAALSAITLGLFMPAFIECFAIPATVLYTLAGIAAVLASYSFTCAVGVNHSYRSLILGVAVANLMYCIVTAAVLLIFWSQMSALAGLYFILEMMVIISLVAIELGVYSMYKTPLHQKKVKQ